MTVRYDLRDVDNLIGATICGSMYRWAGQQLHITRVGMSRHGRFYVVKENEYEWQDHMLEPCDSIDMTAMDSLLL